MKPSFAALAIAGLASVFSVHARAAVAVVPNCCATPLGGSFAVTIWSANTMDADITSASQQALPTNPIVSQAFLAGSGIYTGSLNFNVPSFNGTPTVGDFFASGSGSYGGSGTGATLTLPNFARATVMEFSFTIATALTNLDITHDDGVSLFAAGSSTNLLDAGASAPTTAVTTHLGTLAAGTYNLWYAQVNGLPAVLCVDPGTGGPASVPTPEPASLLLLGAGLATVGLVRRRRAEEAV